MPSQTYLKHSQLFQWYIKVSLPHRCRRLIYGPITGLEWQQCFTFVLFRIFSLGFFLFVDYGKYNICFQNVGLAGIIKESAWQADYLGLLHCGDGDADSYAKWLDLVKFKFYQAALASTQKSTREPWCVVYFQLPAPAISTSYEGLTVREGWEDALRKKKKENQSTFL